LLVKPEKLTPEWVREHFPESCAIADEFKRVFGDGVVMIACRENGEQLGQFPNDSETECNG